MKDILKETQNETEGMLYEIDKLKRVKQGKDKLQTLPYNHYDEAISYM